MQHPTLPLLHFRSKEIADQTDNQAAQDFLDEHSAVLGILRGLVLSAFLWAFLAFAVYTVYNMITSIH